MSDTNLSTSIAAIRTKILNDVPTSTIDDLLSLSRAAKSVGLSEDSDIETAINSRTQTLSSGATTEQITKLSQALKQVRNATQGGLSPSTTSDDIVEGASNKYFTPTNLQSLGSSIIPLTDVTYDLGNTSKKFSSVFTDTVTGLNTPTNNNDAATKAYVDANSSLYGNTNVDTHLNVSGATNGQTLLWNGSDYYWGTPVTQSDIDTSISNLVDSAPAALNTLNELAAALGDDANFSTTITNSLANKLEASDLNGYATETYVGQQISAAGSYSDASVNTHLNQNTATSGQILTWNGSDYDWVDASSSISVSDTAPSSPSNGDLWFDSSNANTYIYYNDTDSNQWIQINGTGQVANVGGGSAVTAYANAAAFPASGNTVGDFAFATDTKAVHIWNGTEWERVQHGSNIGPQFTTNPPTTHSLNSNGSGSNITAVAVDESGFPVTYDWDILDGTTVHTSSSSTYPNQLTNVSESNGVFTLTPSTNGAHAGTFTFRTKASDGAAVTTATTSVSLDFIADIIFPATAAHSTGNFFLNTGTNSFSYGPVGIATNVTQSNYVGYSSELSLGKKYIEIKITSSGNNVTYLAFGIGLNSATFGYTSPNTANLYGNGNFYPGNISGVSNFGALNDVLMIAYDTTAQKAWIGVNNVWSATGGSPTSGAGISMGGSSGDSFKLGIGAGTSSQISYSANVATGTNDIYTYAVPSGFSKH